MITRSKLLNKAIDDCMKELYSFVQPSVDWNDFISQNKLYSNLYNIWEKTKDTNPNYIGKSIIECIGPRPYEFYYLPKDIMKDICDSYVHAYRIDQQQELLDTIEILKNYCKEPIVDKYIEGENGEPGHRGYDHPNNLIEEVRKILIKYDDHMDSEISEEVVNKFFSFLDMAGNFYNWNRDLNSFNVSVYLGTSPYSNKEIVIDNWKKYRNKDIEINEEQIKREYYGDEYDDEELD